MGLNFKPPPKEPEEEAPVARLKHTTEQQKILSWRIECLEKVGYEPQWASFLAKIPELDLKAACDLLASGCPHDTALKILV